MMSYLSFVFMFGFYSDRTDAGKVLYFCNILTEVVFILLILFILFIFKLWGEFEIDRW
jgi:hypothetical protein